MPQKNRELGLRDVVVNKYLEPEGWDQRESGTVNSIRDQGLCASGWAFAAVASIESGNKISSGKLLELSDM